MDLGRDIIHVGLALPLQRFTPGPYDFLNEQIQIEPTSTAEFYTDFNISQTYDTFTNDTNDAIEYELFYRHSTLMTAVYCIAYFIVFIVGLIGNSFVIAVVFRAPRMRTVTNFFIVNLAVADILVIVFCLPATLMSNIFVPWMLGWLMCKTVPYIQGVSVAASVYSLIAVSLDRFLAIWWPLKLQITKKRARLMILGIWIIALGSTIPWALFFDLVAVFPQAPDVQLCMEVWPPGTDGALYFLLANLVACYILPMILISICYILIWIKVWRRSIPTDSKDAQMDRMQQKSKIKVVKMLVVVVILFVVSWLPLYVIFARIKLGGQMSSREEELLQIATPIAQWLGSSNSCINPILYAFFNKKYRKGFVAIIRSKKCCGKLRYYDTVGIGSSIMSQRKSSHYHNQNSTRKPPYSPSIKSESVSYIYEQNNNNNNANNNVGNKKYISKQDSNLSRQMLIKQDSSVSNNSRQMLIKQDSDGSAHLLIKQDSQISYIDYKKSQLIRQNSDISQKKEYVKQDSQVSFYEPKRGILSKQETQISFVENNGHGHVTKKNSLSSQDSINSLIAHKRQRLVKQNSVISFTEPK